MTSFDPVAHRPSKGNQSLNPAILLMEQFFKHDILMKGVPMIALLTTKLFIARPRKNLVSHARLVDCLDIKQNTDLAGITTLAAFGETVSLSDRISQSSRCITLLSTNDITGTRSVALCRLT